MPSRRVSRWRPEAAEGQADGRADGQAADQLRRASLVAPKGDSRADS
jgi:hypothetical protein